LSGNRVTQALHRFCGKYSAMFGDLIDRKC
jgi:hypothetical protein